MANRVSVGLVDDHQLFRESMVAWFAALDPGIELVAATRTVRELLDVWHPIADVVLLDLDLADGTCVEDNIGALVAAGTRVVVVSACAEPPAVRRAVGAGAIGYVPKGAGGEELHCAIRAAADGVTYLTQELATVLLEHSLVIRPALSPQEVRTLQWYAGGMPGKTVARRLGVTEGTVASYVKRIREKYQRVGREAPTKVDLYKRAVEDGYFPVA